MAAAGISVVALPITNLYLQGRDHQQAMPRAVTAVKALQEAGVNVAAGADNLQDPFNPFGRACPLETAGLTTLTTHVLPVDAWRMVTDAGRIALGETPFALEPGAPAETAEELAVELERLAGWLGLHTVVVEPRGDLAPALSSLVA